MPSIIKHRGFVVELEAEDSDEAIQEAEKYVSQKTVYSKEELKATVTKTMPEGYENNSKWRLNVEIKSATCG